MLTLVQESLAFLDFHFLFYIKTLFISSKIQLRIYNLIFLKKKVIYKAISYSPTLTFAVIGDVGTSSQVVLFEYFGGRASS